MPASPLAGIRLPPVSANRIAGAAKPLLVAPELLQRFRGEEFRAVARRMPKRFQQARSDQQGDLFRFETKEPTGLGRRQAGGNNFPTEKFGLL
jgi:hypothetical protein